MHLEADSWERLSYAYEGYMDCKNKRICKEKSGTDTTGYHCGHLRIDQTRDLFYNLFTIVRQVATTGLIALGVSFLMLTGNLDFSVGKLYAFAGVCCALLYQQGMNIWVAIVVSILACVLISMFTGFVSMKFNIPMLIVSIAMMQVVDGINMILTNGATVYGLPDSIKFLGQGYVLGIPFAVIVFAVVAAIVAFVLNRTYLGRYLFAVGGNNETARLSGIHVNQVKMIASIICGLLTGIAGIIMMSRSFSGSPYNGTSMSNDVISAAVLGGVSISGGTGKTSGVVIIGILSQGLVMIGMSSNYQNMIKGAILILSVIMDQKSKVAKRKKK